MHAPLQTQRFPPPKPVGVPGHDLNLSIVSSLPLNFMSTLSIVDTLAAGGPPMKSMSARDAKNEFGRLIDTARAEPVTIEKHGRPVVVVLSIEEYRRISGAPGPSAGRPAARRKKE
jgi:prevent-host-death family protein